MNGGDELRQWRPHAALREIVDCYWAVGSDAHAPSRRILPDGCIDVVLDRRGGTAVLVGAMTTAHEFTADGPVEIVGVRLRPGGAHALFGADCDAFTDGHLPIGDMAKWLGDGVARAFGAPSDALAVRELERAMLMRAPRAAGDAVAAALHELVACPQVAVEAIARGHGISRQHFTRRVRARTGLGPKSLAAILRLQRALPLLHSELPLAAVAARGGYADQAHFAREVRRLSGITASELRQELA